MSEPFQRYAADAPRLPAERRVLLHGVSWEQFEHWLEMRGDDNSVRVAYLDGELELMSPGPEHEDDNADIERLLYVWSDETGTDLSGSGSVTVMSEAAARGAEADTSIVVGSRREGPPHIVVEVISTRPLLDKLDIYWQLGVREVWCWRRGKGFQIFTRGRKNWLPGKRSKLLPDLRLALLAEFVGWSNPSDAARAYREAVRKSLKRRRS